MLKKFRKLLNEGYMPTYFDYNLNRGINYSTILDEILRMPREEFESFINGEEVDVNMNKVYEDKPTGFLKLMKEEEI